MHFLHQDRRKLLLFHLYLVVQVKKFQLWMLIHQRSYGNLFEHSPSTHFCSQQAELLSAAFCHASPLYKTQRIWGVCKSICKRSLLPGCQVPPYFLLGLNSLGKTGAKIKQVLDFPRVIQVENQMSCLPLQFLVPQPGAQSETKRGQSSITAALVPWSHRRQEGTSDVSFQHL